MHTNRLIHEKSPYLQQHAHNPVDWYAWGEEAFEKARNEDKPVFLSVGYSTCHWCHVMERESFEAEDVAQVLNRDFVPIKVDREERPDVDRIYMMFVQASTGSGGWPMSVWLTPDLKPFYGGTYFPPDNRYGRPGFKNVLESVANAWRTSRAKIAETSGEAIKQLTQHAEVKGSPAPLAPKWIDSCYFQCRRMFDPQLGGFGSAPKFPRPVLHNFLLRYYASTGNEEALEMVVKTLHSMAKGGMNDQLGGGFHRYSVDERWFVPHFEKMLYDQAQLAISYLEAYQITKDSTLAQTARETLDYVLRDMTHPEGGFYSAEDADSVIDPAKPEEKGEGSFYVWTWEEIERLLGPETAKAFAATYGVRAEGNVDHDPQGEFTGKNILYRAGESGGLIEAKATLLAARAKRVRPHLDDKVLTAWNALMISAFAKAAQVLNEEKYLDAAIKATEFVVDKMYDPQLPSLSRRFRAGDAGIPGFLDDYAFFANALIDMYETTFEYPNLRLAVRLTDRMLALFEDKEHGAFFSTPADEPDLVMRVKDDYDGAEPSGNSMAAMALLRLAQYTGRQDYAESAQKALNAFGPRMEAAPHAIPQMMTAFQFSRVTPRQVVVAGGRDLSKTRKMIELLHAQFAPDRIVLLIDSPETREKLAAGLPMVKEMAMAAGDTTAYVCENNTCRLPTSDMDEFRELLK